MEKVPELCIEHLVAKPFAAELYVLTSASGGAMEAVTEAVERVWPQRRRDETDSPAPRVTSTRARTRTRKSALDYLKEEN